MKKILITGGAGFIGSNFANINQNKYEITILDSLIMGDRENIYDHEIVHFFEGDAGEINDLKKCGGQFDYVLYLAGTSTAPKFAGDGFVSGYVNSIKSFVQTLEFARMAGAKKFLYASTSSLYGNNPVPLTEDQKIIPPNHYSVTKFLYENCVRCYQKVYPKMETIGFRFMSVYGPNEEAKGPYANLVSQFIWDMVRGKSPLIYGDGTQYRDFTNVKDVVSGITKAIETEKFIGNDVFNIGTGEYASLNDIVNLINHELIRLKKQSVEAAYIPNPIKENYVQSQHADITKINQILGYEPSVNIKTGIADQIANIRMDKIRKTSSDILKEEKELNNK